VGWIPHGPGGIAALRGRSDGRAATQSAAGNRNSTHCLVIGGLPFGGYPFNLRGVRTLRPKGSDGRRIRLSRRLQSEVTRQHTSDTRILLDYSSLKAIFATMTSPPSFPTTPARGHRPRCRRAPLLVPRFGEPKQPAHFPSNAQMLGPGWRTLRWLVRRRFPDEDEGTRSPKACEFR
jgi:hypothetical protein